MTTKLTVMLPDKTVEDVKHLARRNGVAVTRAFINAIQGQQFLEREEGKGNRIILDRSNTPGACLSDVAFSVLHPFGPSPDPRRHWRLVRFR